LLFYLLFCLLYLFLGLLYLLLYLRYTRAHISSRRRRGPEHARTHIRTRHCLGSLYC
jgi:hypothetical protein